MPIGVGRNVPFMRESESDDVSEIEDRNQKICSASTSSPHQLAAPVR